MSLRNIRNRIKRLEENKLESFGWVWQILAKGFNPDFDGSDKEAESLIEERREKQTSGNYIDNYKSPMAV